METVNAKRDAGEAQDDQGGLDDDWFMPKSMSSRPPPVSGIQRVAARTPSAPPPCIDDPLADEWFR